MIYLFEGHSLDCERRELRRGQEVVPVEPQVFDLLQFLIRHRERVVSKDELLAGVWNGRLVSDSTLSSRVNAARHAVGDRGDSQRLIRTVARKGLRFVAVVQERTRPVDEAPGAPDRAPTSPTRSSSSVLRERRQLTILACTLTGASSSSPADPEDLRDALAARRDCVRNAVERYGGFVATHTLDGIVAYYGYPQAHEDDAERAVRAGLAVVDAVDAVDTHCARPVRVQAAIATGLVIVGGPATGGVGSDHVIGEAPSLAGRLLSLAAPGDVVMCATTRRLAGGWFEHRDLDTHEADSPGGVEPPSRVIGERVIADRFAALRPARAPLIGRDEEFTVLQRRWTRTKSGEGSVVLLWGEPGIGKSHLVAALQDWVRAEAHATLRYFCSPHRGQTALYPVVSQVEHAAGFVPTDGDAAKLDKLAGLLAAASNDVTRDVALVAELLGIRETDRYPPLSLSAQRRKELLLEWFVGQIVALTAHGSVLVVLEDAHWIDATTAEFFDVLIERSRGMPLLIVMTYRPEFVPPWLGQAHVTALTLSRLGLRDTAALVRYTAGGRGLPTPLLELIVQRTDGVPLFIEEVTKSVLESGALDEAAGEAVLAGSQPAFAVPSTLQASLAARLDRLLPARALVQASATLGREFSYAMLKAVTALPDSEITPLLDLLVASELLHRRGTAPHATYVFKHALVQDAAYSTMLRDQRVQMHRRIVEALQHEFIEYVARHPDVLAYHCAEAGLWAEAIDFRIKAARMALARSAGVEAHAQVEQAMRLTPKLAGGATQRQIEGRLQVALGDALAMTVGFASPQVKEALSKARGLLDESLSPTESLGAVCGLFNYHMIRSESPRCLELAEPLLRGQVDQRTKVVGHYLAGAAHLHLGNLRQSIDHLETALSLYDDQACRSIAFVGGYHLRSFTLIWLSLGYLYVGSLKLAADTINEAVSDARRRSHPFTLVSALLALARFCSHTHDVRGAIDATEEGATIALEQRSPYHVSRAAILRALNTIDCGRPDEGIAQLERALVAHRSTGANFQSSYNLSRLASAQAQVGRSALAVDLADQAIAEVERSGERWWEAEAHRIRAALLVAAGAADDRVEVCLLTALACARRQRAGLWELHAAESLALLWSRQGRHREARELLAPVCAAFTDGPATPNVCRARRTLEGLGRAT